MAPRPTQAPIAISVGDINGVGPEIALKAVCDFEWPAAQRFVLVGPAAVVAEQARRLRRPMPRPWRPGLSFPDRRVAVWDTCANEAPPRWAPGRVSATAGRQALRAAQLAVEAAQRGEAAAVVTAPICKEALQRAGLGVAGHTERLAEWTRARRVAMLLEGGGLRVALATTHLPLRRVPKALTRAAVRKTIELCAQALPWLGCPRGRIAVCGLNPHAGEGGALGDEEQKVIAPEIRRARNRGLPVAGPIPADVVFHQALQGKYDLVVAMYHDQGLGPLKTVGFETGVNITLGLPIVRVSPDHGTAFDIAGQGRADPRSMVAAIRRAAELAARPNPWRAA